MSERDLSLWAKRELLRHALATIAYRGAKVLRDAPKGFGALRVGESTRTPGEILAHIGDLFDWAIELVHGNYLWHDSVPGQWDDDVARFFGGLARLDDYFASDKPIGFSAERLLQGPIADALTHIGQLAMLRRVAGSPVKGESYFKADVVIGRIGPEQSAPRRES
jgi:hypothetical protein